MKAIGVVCFLLLLSGCSDYDSDYLQGYVEGQYTYLSSIVDGQLQKLSVARGQTVAKGQKLFDLDQEPELSQLNKAQSDLAVEQAKLQDYLVGQRNTVLAAIMAQRDQAQADLDLANSNFARISQLYQKGVVSRASYDDAQAQVKANQERVNQYEQNLKEAEQGERQYRIVQQRQAVSAAEAAVTEAKWRLSQKSVYAPEAGFVQDTLFNIGEEVSANRPIISFLTPDNVYVVFFIPEPKRAKVTIGDEIGIDCDGCPDRFVAVINYLSSHAEYTPPVIYSRESSSKLVYRVQARLPMALTGPLYPGQPVEVYLKKNPGHRQQISWRMRLHNLWDNTLQWLKKLSMLKV